MSQGDYGLFITRPNVTIQGIHFEDYVRGNWSTGINIRKNADNIKIENCSVNNATIGFTVAGNDVSVINCKIDDSGTGIYLQGENAIIKNNRLFKIRDQFIVPRYHQEDAAIEFYYPAKGGIVQNNLCMGFSSGIFIKAHRAHYSVSHNTVIGGDECRLGIASTKWSKNHSFNYNIVQNFKNLMEVPADSASLSSFGYNCFWNGDETKVKSFGSHSIIANPKFVDPMQMDFRLKHDSPCSKLINDQKPCGAFAIQSKKEFDQQQGLQKTFKHQKQTTLIKKVSKIIDKKDIESPSLLATVIRKTKENKEWHVSSKGTDGNDGSLTHPVKTIQYAVDRAWPGDTIIIHNGIYPEPVTIKRGGKRNKPLIIKANEPWKAILDSNRMCKNMITIDQTSYVEIYDLQIRWYQNNAIYIKNSKHCKIIGCKIWNDLWQNNWPSGIGIKASQSPYLTIWANLCFRQEYGIYLSACYGSVVSANTCVSNLYAGIFLSHSAEDSECMYNSLAFQGNDVIFIQESSLENLKSLKCDYNNYGTFIRKVDQKAGVDTLTPQPKDRHISARSKAIIYYYEKNQNGKKQNRIKNLKEWQKFSGLDQNSIFEDPLYVDSENYDFRLQKNSPNVIDKSQNVLIGAFGVAEEF